MSAAAGSVLASPTVNREEFIQDKVVNYLCFSMIDHIANVFKESGSDFRFLIKGGAAATLSLTGNPLTIINDIDCTVLINPKLKSPSEFEMHRMYAVSTCIGWITHTLNNLHVDIYDYIRKQCIDYNLTPLTTPPPIRIGRAASDGIALRTGTETFIEMNGPVLKSNCPLFIDIWPSLTFRGESLQMAVIRLRTNTDPSVDLLDIALPAQSYSRLPYEWKTYTTIPLTVYAKAIPILNPLAQIQNQEYATEHTHRGISAAFNAKANRRSARTAALRATFGPADAVAEAGGAGGAGGAGAAASGVPLFVANTGALRRLPIGPPLNFVRKSPQGKSKELLRAGIVIPVTSTAGRTLQLKQVPAQYLGAHRDLYRNLRRESSQFVVLDREGYFKPLGKDPRQDPKTGQWGILGYDGIMYFFE